MAVLVHLVYEHLPLLSDVLALRNSCHSVRDIGSSILSKRFDDMVKPYVGTHIKQFRHLMHSTHAVIVGSCAMQMLLGDVVVTRDLNILVAHGGRLAMHSFIAHTLHYQRIYNVHTNYVYKDCTTNFAKYECGERLITLTEAAEDGLFKVISSSPTTADMTFMTVGGLAVLYPEWTLNHTTVINHTVLSTEAGKNVGCIEQCHWKVESGTAFLGKPCGSLCPYLWRNIRDSVHQGHILQWDMRQSVTSLMCKSNTMWRLAEHCQNIECPFNPIVNGRLTQLPPKEIPGDLRGIQQQEHRIEDHLPVRTIHTFSLNN